MSNKTSLAALLLALLLPLVAMAAPITDGPYVADSADGNLLARWAEGEPGSLTVRETRVAPQGQITVAPVGKLPPFDVELRNAAGVAPDRIRVGARTPIFVIADTHGEFEIAVELLQRHGVIDQALRWSFGKGHLAILGDVFDRGAHQTELLWLFYKLEAEAARAGGAVHLALGNHEVIVLKSDERYLHPKYRQVATALGASRYADLFDERSVLGRWLRSKAAVFRLGDYLCLHGGISREVVDRKLTLAELNSGVRAALQVESTDSAPRAHMELVLGKAGPLWYRGYFRDAALEGGFTLAEPADIDAILKTYKARRILVGHTIVPTITPLFGGRVIAVQVYPRRDEKTGAPNMEGLLIKGDRLFRARIDGTNEPLFAAGVARQSADGALPGAAAGVK
jgi:hypothetical protein